ncbi:MAG: repeat-containing protein YrrB [Planctomycetota bacterium]
MRSESDEPHTPRGRDSAQSAQTAQTERSRVDAGRAGRDVGGVLFPALLAVTVLVAWSGAIAVGFVFDDIPRIARNETAIDALWPPSEWLFGNQRPLVQGSLALNYALGALDPRGYHLFNIVVHAANAVLLFYVVRAAMRVLRARGALRLASAHDATIALVVAAVWALHPLAASAATYIVQRAESMAACGTLAAVLAILRATPAVRGDGRPPARFVIAVPIFAALAILSKPTALSAPFLVVLVDAYIVFGSFRLAWTRRWPTYVATFATLAILAAVGVFEGVFGVGSAATDRLSGYGANVPGVDAMGYAALSLRALGLYALHVVSPAWLAIDRGPDALAAGWMPIVGAIVLVGGAVLAVVGIARRAWWAVLPLATALILAPTTSIVPLADAAVDHRMYLPLAMVLVALVALFAPMVLAAQRGTRIVATLLVAALVMIEIFAIAERNRVFSDPVALWSEVVAQSPAHARGFINRAGALLEAGRDDEAAADLARAQELMPGNPTLLVNLAILDLRSGDAARAIERLDIATKGVRADHAVLGARGDALRRLGRFDEAGRNYALAAERAPTDALYPLLAGNAFSEAGDVARAAESYAEALERARVARDAELEGSAAFNLGNLRFAQSAFDDAARAYREALAADPMHEGARTWLPRAEEAARSATKQDAETNQDAGKKEQPDG